MIASTQKENNYHSRPLETSKNLQGFQSLYEALGHGEMIDRQHLHPRPHNKLSHGRESLLKYLIQQKLKTWP